VVLTMRALALAFAAFGVLFLVAPDDVIGTTDDLGEVLGSFSPAADTDHKLWLALAFAYMAVIAAIALVVSTDVVRYRPLLLVLVVGKAASSLAAGGYFLFDDGVFVYLLGFLVDGSLVGLTILCWVLAGRVARDRGEPARATALT
jgi:hypothetical protein